MKFIPYTLLIIFVYFLSKTIRGRKIAKLNFENLAAERLNRYISKLESENEHISYKYFEYKRIPFNKIIWHMRSLEEIKEAIKIDCTKASSEGVSHYAKARFTVNRDPIKNYIYFYIGDNNYKFNDIRKKS
jgi:hypothetical protein